MDKSGGGGLLKQTTSNAAETNKFEKKGGLINFSGYSYIIDSTRMNVDNTTIEIPSEYEATNEEDVKKFYYSKENHRIWCTVNCTHNAFTEETLLPKNKAIKVTVKDCVLCPDGTYKDLELKLSNMQVRHQKASKKFTVLKQVPHLNRLELNSNRFGNDDKNHEPTIGIQMHITGRVFDADDSSFVADGKLLYFLYDLDVMGFNDDYSGGFSDYCEGVRLGDGCGNVVHGHSGGTYIHASDNNRVFYGSQGTSGDEQIKSAISFLANAGGFQFDWTGKQAGTGIGFELDAFTWDYFHAETSIQYETKDSTPQAKKYTTAKRIPNSYRQSLSGMYMDYSYTLKNEAALAPTGTGTINLTNNVIYKNPKPSETTVGETSLLSSKTYLITVERESYKYEFDENRPERTVNTVSNMPSDITKLAENTCGSIGKTPSLKGYTFKGWATSPTGDVIIWNPNEEMLSDKTFYATWEPIPYHVDYNANGSTNFSHETGEFTQNQTAGSMERSTFSYDVKGKLSDNAFTREGYAFKCWNTKPDGSGMSYPDGYDNVLNWSDTKDGVITLYAQWTKKLGTETLTVVSEETGNPVSGVDLKLYQNGDATNITKTTDKNGQVTVDNLHWFDYEWRSTSVPNGYKGMTNVSFSIYPNCNTDGTLCDHTSGTRPASGKARLTVTNERILYMKHVSLQLDASVSEVIDGEEAPAFFYHVEGPDAAGVTHAYDVMVPVGSNLKGSNTIPDLFAGVYEVTQTPVSRYRPGNAKAVAHASVNGIHGTADLLHNIENGDKGEIQFPYTMKQVGGFSSIANLINQLLK